MIRLQVQNFSEYIFKIFPALSVTASNGRPGLITLLKWGVNCCPALFSGAIPLDHARTTLLVISEHVLSRTLQ
jgi:hypothetical protein